MSHILCIRLLFEKVILSDKNGMYLMTGRKWEWRLPVVDNESNEPWIILLLYINHIYQNRFTVILLNQYFTTSHKSSAFFRPGRSRSWQDRIISKTIFSSDQILVPKILFLPRKDRSFRNKTEKDRIVSIGVGNVLRIDRILSLKRPFKFCLNTIWF